jgi:hypothetical protein
MKKRADASGTIDATGPTLHPPKTTARTRDTNSTITITDRLSPLLRELIPLISTTAPELRQRLLEVFKRSVDFVQTTLDLDDAVAVRAGDLRLVLEPTSRLLELAAALRTRKVNGSVEHGGTP